MIKDFEKEKFAALCAANESAQPPEVAEIGTYNEKRIHKIIKRFVCDNECNFEIKVGRFVADVLNDGKITEIQTAGFTNLKKKLDFYLNSTDYSVTVIYPLIAEKTLIRADKESGELISVKKSPKHLHAPDSLPQLFYIAEFIGNPRLELKLFMIRADEYRYSERMRYRKAGKYDNDLLPRELLDIVTLTSPEDFRAFIPAELVGIQFSAADFSKATKIKGRNAYRALGCLTELGLLEKIPTGKRSFMFFTLF